MIDYRKSTPRVQGLIARFSIKVNSPFQLARHLSGGNQQKVVVAREFNLDNPVLVVSQPSRGVDIASTRFIHEQLMALRNAGKGILLISTDLDEVFALSDRILVLFEGRITGEFTPHDITREEIGLYMTGAKHQVADDGKAGGCYNS
ncbi:MAG: ral nucleoside transport system ATP-binding protein [Clostridia bacterium]|nr:ral nucleoside transport system ATP-binding protein [Clostridia bacterium]